MSPPNVWPADLSAAMAPETWTTSNLGISGSTAELWADTYITPQLAGVGASNRTRFVLVNIGSNDSVNLPSEATWRADFGAILDAIHTKYPHAPVYTMRPWRAGYDAGAATLKTWIEAEEAERPGWAFAGPNEAVWAKAGDNGATNYSDGIHYSVAGNAACVTAWRTVLGY